MFFDSWSGPGRVALVAVVVYILLVAMLRITGKRNNAFGYQGRGYDQVNTNGVSFSADSVATLKPGSVPVQRYDESSSGDWVDIVITREEFDRQGQDPTNCR
ncbi:hypothetical protein ACIBF6_44050 [Streptosporangium amethystogenes]|uniref:hypothetical protein n=1 Tax=Streptosporangium amethystogenes TaxID=2002 RepID=UPI00379E23BD